MTANPNFDNYDEKESAANFTETWPEKKFSISVNSLFKKLSGLTEGADLIEVCGVLMKIHPEYGTKIKKAPAKSAKPILDPFQQLYAFLQGNQRSLSLKKLSSAQWAAEALSIFQTPPESSVIHGRLFLISALLFSHEEVRRQIDNPEEWTELCTELIHRVSEEDFEKSKIPYQSLLTPKGKMLYDTLSYLPDQEPSEILEDSIIDTNNLSDGPAKEDSLSRKALAKYLAKRLRHIYNRDIDKGKYGSFFMHIDGSWGSGKSTLLGFLEEELEQSRSTGTDTTNQKLSEGKWVVINFNAWENQRLDPPWWFLMKALYLEAIESLKANNSNIFSEETIKKDKRKIRKLVWREYYWRYNTGNNFLWVALITLLLFVFALIVNANTEKEFKSLPVIELITFLGFLWSLAKVFGSSLASGSAKAAQNFIQENSKDPLKVIADHFKEQIDIIGYPVAIFIDDLDRCNKDYGIKLLEGLQTIFKKAGVVYVIAADRKWLSTMYKHQYEIFAPVIEKPTKPFGMVFLDKIFQLIVELPDISAVQKKIYWDNLLSVGQKANDAKMKEANIDIQAMVKAAGSNPVKMTDALLQTNDPQIEQLGREEFLGSVSITEEENKLEHKLQHFVDLIEPNPRAMKRLINDISTARAISFLYKQEVDEDQLILWTIFKLQHPLLAEYFWNNPEKMDKAADYNDLTKPLTGEPEFDRIIANPEVKMLFKYSVGEREIPLNKAFILKLKFQTPPEK